MAFKKSLPTEDGNEVDVILSEVAGLVATHWDSSFAADLAQVSLRSPSTHA